MTRRGRLFALLTALAMTSLALVAPQSSAVADTGSAPEFTKTVDISRVHLTNGADEVVETKHVTVNVGQTSGLRDRQEIGVSWTGAHPSGGTLPDPNAGNAAQQEYPVVLLECRGTDSSSVPAAQQLNPTTCWTATPSERYSAEATVAFPPWRVDRYATPADRTANPGQPSPRPDKCGSVPTVERWLPFVAADGTTYYGGPNGCAGIPPEGSLADATLSFPSNTTYATSDLQGNGSVNFDVRDATDNASLGCSQSVPCALVVVPILGIGCDVTAAGLPDADRPAPGAQADAAAKTCRATGKYAPGQQAGLSNNSEDVAVSGGMWWSGSNWRNRVTVPLHFAPPSNLCDLVAGQPPVLMYGSELMIQATTSWGPTFCLNPALRSFKHVQVPEPEARSLVTARTIEAALVSDPPPVGGYPTPTVHAPVAVTGFSISFIVDNQNRDRVTSLKLTPRLLAKLMSESYPAINRIGYAALEHNPLNMAADPEFIALNPGIGNGGTATSSTLLSIASDSDVLHALTSYINADPEARAWLDGKPDPWGMVVNPNYKGIALPTDSWPLLDSFEPLDYYNSGINPCLQFSPVPLLPLIAAPMSRMALIAQAVQYAIAQPQLTCLQPQPGFTEGQKLVAQGRQAGGGRFIIGVTSIADAKRFGLGIASLQTHVDSGAPAKFTDSTGRSFATATTDTLAAAAQLLVQDPASKSWPIPYSTLRTDARGVSAYPGTMVVYDDVLKAGLPAADAKALSQFMRYAAGAGQTPGIENGQLPDGYLPMTSANGLGALAAYTMAAADQVQNQTGNPPPVSPTPAPTSDTSMTTDQGSGDTGGGSTPSDTSSGTADGSASAAPTASSQAGPSLSPVSLGKTVGETSGLGSLAIPGIVGLALLGLVGVGLTYLLGRRRTAM
jgi:hypothetical protein